MIFGKFSMKNLFYHGDTEETNSLLKFFSVTPCLCGHPAAFSSEFIVRRNSLDLSLLPRMWNVCAENA